MGLNWKHSSSLVVWIFLSPAHCPLQVMACFCFLFFFLVVRDTVRCLSKDESETLCVVQCTVMWMACCQHWLKELWQISSGDEGGGISLQLGKLQWQLYWAVSVLLVWFLLPKCQCFSIACSQEKESREFSMSKSQNMCYCLNSPQFVSCSQQAVIMYHEICGIYYALLQFLMSFVFLIYTGEAKGQTRSGRRALKCSFNRECITWFGLGYFIHVSQFGHLWK